MLLKSDTIFTGTLVLEFGKLVKPYTFATAEPDSSNLLLFLLFSASCMASSRLPTVLVA